MSARIAVPAALLAAAVIAGCGGEQGASTTATVTAPEARDRPPTPKPSERQISRPTVRISVRNGLCSPDQPAAPAGEAFTLVVSSTDRAYEFIFETKPIEVPAGGSGRLRVSARPADEPVLTLAGEPCAVIKVS